MDSVEQQLQDLHERLENVEHNDVVNSRRVQHFERKHNELLDDLKHAIEDLHHLRHQYEMLVTRTRMCFQMVSELEGALSLHLAACAHARKITPSDN